MSFLSHAAIWLGFHPRLMVALKISVVNGDLPYPEPIIHHPCHPCHPCLASDVLSLASLRIWAYDSMWIANRNRHFLETYLQEASLILRTSEDVMIFLKAIRWIDIFQSGDWRLSFCIWIPSGRRVVLWTKMWKGVALSANGWAKRLGRDGIELAFHILFISLHTYIYISLIYIYIYIIIIYFHFILIAKVHTWSIHLEAL